MSVLIADLSNVNSVPAKDAFDRMKKFGVAGCFLKVTEGLTFNDSYFPMWEALAEHAGLRVGGYHYAHPESHTPREEAEHFLLRYRGHDDRKALRAVLDFEEPKALRLGHWVLERWARSWMHLVHHELGHWPLFYSYPDYIRQMELKTPIGGGLWLASFSRNDGTEHPYSVPSPWKHVLCHQYCSTGRLPGVNGNVDLSDAPKLLPLLARPFAGAV